MGSAHEARWAGISPAVSATVASRPSCRLSVSNSWSGRHWELDQVPAVGDLTDIVQLGTGHHVSVGEGQRRVALQRRVAAHLVVSGHGPRSPARDRTITLVKQLGRRRWKKASGYHRQSRVENAFFRYKSIIGDGLRARSPAGQGSEVVLGCEILNRMTAPQRHTGWCRSRPVTSTRD